MIAHGHAYPRVALVGNPSDGYGGKTIATTFRNYAAKASVVASEGIRFVGPDQAPDSFASVEDFLAHVTREGYDGPNVLAEATARVFIDQVIERPTATLDSGFELTWGTTVPESVGLAGSSAIVIACFRALLEFTGREIAPAQLAELALEVEVEELGIPAGPQDRVTQAFEGLVYMDFGASRVSEEGIGDYRQLDPAGLPPLFIAYSTGLSESSKVAHRLLRERHQGGDSQLAEAVEDWKRLTDMALSAIEEGRPELLGPIMDRNFDIRRSVGAVGKGDGALVDLVRAAGGHANQAGSGGAIVGTHPLSGGFTDVTRKLEEVGCVVIEPVIG